MLVLSGKKIKYAILGSFLIIFLVTILLNFDSNDEQYISTVALPVSGKTVVLDAGHGVPDEGGKMLKPNSETHKY